MKEIAHALDRSHHRHRNRSAHLVSHPRRLLKRITRWFGPNEITRHRRWVSKLKEAA